MNQTQRENSTDGATLLTEIPEAYSAATEAAPEKLSERELATQLRAMINRTMISSPELDAVKLFQALAVECIDELAERRAVVQIAMVDDQAWKALTRTEGR